LEKLLIVLAPSEVLRLQGVIMDRDPQEALSFVLEVISPKVHERVPCLDMVPIIMPIEK